jgi:ubiquinone/menaquinone biosynthesis C-methylase UbiE
MSQLESNKEFDKRAHLFDFLQDLGSQNKEKHQVWTKNQLDAIHKLIKDQGMKIEDSIIVDIGGGTGRLAIPLSLDCNKLILAEPSEQMLSIAKRKCTNEKHGEIVFLKKGFLDLDLAPNSVDVVISINDPFQFILDKQEQLYALENMKRILKPGGILILELMNFFSLIFRIKTPEPKFWETEDYKGSLFLNHSMHKLKGIWYHTENIYIEDKKTGRIEHTKVIHKLKNVSSTELELLHERVGYENIQIYPGHNLDDEDGNRFLSIARKPQ